MGRLSAYPLVPDDPTKVLVRDKRVSMGIDKKGIYTIYKKKEPHKKVYNPLSIAQYALSNYNLYTKTGDRHALIEFKKYAKKLLQSFKQDKLGVWRYEFAYSGPGINCNKGWASSIMQGMGISTLVRYYPFTKGEERRMTAKSIQDAVKSYTVPIEKGGILRIDKQGYTWYEEYACEKTITVLNGFLYSLIGLLELHRFTGDKNALQLFNRGLFSLKDNIRKFELHLPLMKWTKYADSIQIFSWENYHQVHIDQMKYLYDLTGDKFFYVHWKKWLSWKLKYTKTLRFKLYKLLCAIYILARIKVMRLLSS